MRLPADQFNLCGRSFLHIQEGTFVSMRSRNFSSTLKVATPVFTHTCMQFPVLFDSDGSSKHVAWNCSFACDLAALGMEPHPSLSD